MNDNKRISFCSSILLGVELFAQAMITRPLNPEIWEGHILEQEMNEIKEASDNDAQVLMLVDFFVPAMKGLCALARDLARGGTVTRHGSHYDGAVISSLCEWAKTNPSEDGGGKIFYDILIDEYGYNYKNLGAIVHAGAIILKKKSSKTLGNIFGNDFDVFINAVEKRFSVSLN